MQNASVATKSGKIAEGRVVRSLVGDAKPKLLDQLREALRARHYSRRTEQTYCLWVKRFTSLIIYGALTRSRKLRPM